MINGGQTCFLQWLIYLFFVRCVFFHSGNSNLIVAAIRCDIIINQGKDTHWLSGDIFFAQFNSKLLNANNDKLSSSEFLAFYNCQQLKCRYKVWAVCRGLSVPG